MGQEAKIETRYCEDCRFFKDPGFGNLADAVCSFPRKLQGRALVARELAPLPRHCTDERIWPASLSDSCGPDASRFEPKPAASDLEAA